MLFNQDAIGKYLFSGKELSLKTACSKSPLSHVAWTSKTNWINSN